MIGSEGDCNVLYVLEKWNSDICLPGLAGDEKTCKMTELLYKMAKGC
jgi:hypothetical protein